MSFPLLAEAHRFLDGLESITRHDNGEPLVPVPQDRRLFRSKQSPWSFSLLLGRHYLRRGVLEKLQAAAETIVGETGGRYRVQLLDTYRPPPIQQMNYTVVSAYNRMAVKGLKTARDVRAYTNMFTAVPDLGAHPCGAAIDMTLFDTRTGESLVFGDDQMGIIFNHATELGTTPPPPELADLYGTMCTAMKDQGFTMTPCGWWHFMHSDAEWAWLTGRGATLYTTVPYDVRRLTRP